MNVFRRLRLRLFVFLRLVSRPAYYAYGLGDEVRLSAEIMPVRVRWTRTFRRLSVRS
ncbi:MAG: hypothetical protein ABR878_18315 [Roseiarcus sp.]|jgi:KUP system potassium uptake protein